MMSTIRNSSGSGNTLGGKSVLLTIVLIISICFTGNFALAQDINIDYDSLSHEQLQQIIDSANEAIQRNHQVSGSDSSYLESKTKSTIEKLVADRDSNPSWRWFDWNYTRDWHTVKVITEVKINGTWLPLEVVYTDETGDFELVYALLDDELIAGNTNDKSNNGSPANNQNEKSSEQHTNESNSSEIAASSQDSQISADAVIAQLGDKNETVKTIQSMLIQLGYLSGTADGDYGNKTKNAVEMFQTSHKLNNDGIVTESVFAAIQNQFNSLPQASTDSNQDSKNYIRISASKLNDAYQNNEVSADSTYKGQTIEVSGKIGSVSKTFGTVYVRLDADEYGIFTVACAMRKDQEQAVGQLKKGQKVVIRGKCSGLSLIEVYLDDCKIIN